MPQQTPKGHEGPGSGVHRLAEVMATLRAPGGCPWDAAQTHASLLQYLLEEAYEAADAVEHGSRAQMREELGDVLLQVVFHAAIAADDPEDPFSLDDIANEVADKLVRRHPQVFSDSAPAEKMTAAQSHRRWDQIKAAEKSRQSVLDGIPIAQPALARAQKVVARAERGGIEVAQAKSSCLGDQLMDLVHQAEASGLDAETELRKATKRLEKDIRNQETKNREE
ncbi:MAG: MazG family protein [Micrococcales bacterium]|nr:MazG family protein [Micrococcales bacterium]